MEIVSTYARLLQRCVLMKSLAEGKRIHAHILFTNGLDSNMFLVNNLLNMYTKCGRLADAVNLFDRMPKQNTISWTIMISAYADEGRGEEALSLFERMRWGGVKPNEVTFASALKACAALGALEKGKQIHTSAKKCGFDSDGFVEIALIDMYVKCGSLEDARQTFDRMHSFRHVVAWSVMISGYAHNGHLEESFTLFEKMQKDGVKPNEVTVASLLKASTSLADLKQGKRVHAIIEESGFEPSVFVGSALVDMYGKCGSIRDARRVFDGTFQLGVVVWNAMILGYAHHEDSWEALSLFNKMQCEGIKPNEVTFTGVLKACASLGDLEEGRKIHERIKIDEFDTNTFVGNTLIDMYAKCGSIEDARRVFDGMHQRRGVVSWNAMITGYALHGYMQEAFALFERMQQEGVNPDEVTLISILKACAGSAALEQGKHVHAFIKRIGLQMNAFVANALLDMYAKCGSLVEAQQTFDGMCRRDLVSWNAMIAGYALHGHGKEAFALFEKMPEEGMKPDVATFTSVLSACSHEGLINEANHVFDSMSRDHGIKPKVEHYTCMVYLFGRLGQVAKAEDLIEKMPMQPSAAIWMALLGSCRIQGNTDAGRRAFWNALKLEPRNASSNGYAALSSIDSVVGSWNELAKLRT